MKHVRARRYTSNGRDSPSGPARGPFRRHGTHASEGPPGSRHAPSGPCLPTRSLARTHPCSRAYTHTHAHTPTYTHVLAKYTHVYRSRKRTRKRFERTERRKVVDPGGHAAQWRSSDYSQTLVLVHASFL